MKKNATELEGIEQLKESLNDYYVIQIYIYEWMHTHMHGYEITLYFHFSWFTNI